MPATEAQPARCYRDLQTVDVYRLNHALLKMRKFRKSIAAAQSNLREIRLMLGGMLTLKESPVLTGEAQRVF